MAPVTTKTINAQTTLRKKTRRGIGKKRQARTVSDVDMAVDEDSALTVNNKEGIVSLLDPSSTSPSQTLPSTTLAQQAAAASAIDKSTQQDEDDKDMLLDTSPPTAPPATKNGEVSAGFSPLPAAAAAQSGTKKSEIRRIPIPPHRMSPLKKDWVNIFVPLTEICGLQVRMNVQRRTVEVRTSKETKEVGALQKGADFVKAYALGFDVNDAIALLRMDDLYLDSFEIKDVKTLHGDHLSRAIGRIAGQDGKTKFTIENASRTRIVLADTKIHILGSFQNIKIARDAVVSLILGSPPGKVYASLRTIGARMKQRAI